MRWRIVELEITSEDLVLATVANNRFTITFLAHLWTHDRVAVLTDMHIQGAGANTMGNAALIGLAHAFMEAIDVDHLAVEGATRTTGSGPGRRPAPFFFRRRRRIGTAPDSTD
jgi:hypothetical protein